MREDYYTNDIEGAAGYEAMRQASDGPWPDDDRPTLRELEAEDRELEEEEQ